MKRANIGCGSIRPEGWSHFDIEGPFLHHDAAFWDVRKPLVFWVYDEERFDYAVAHHVLSAPDHHELVPALRNIRAILKPGGTLRVSVPWVIGAFRALEAGDEEWFPQSDSTGRIDAKFCTYVTWFGTHRSVFTEKYLEACLYNAKFVDVKLGDYRWSQAGLEGITDLDSRKGESIFMEATA